MGVFDVVKKYRDSYTAHRPEDGGRIAAVEICSNLLEAHIWLALDPDFAPADGQAVFYPHELPTLRTKTVQQLRQIHQVKAIFGTGSMVKK